MAARNPRTGVVFFKDQEMADDEVKRLETKEGYFFVEKPRLATEDEIKESGIKYFPDNGWKLWTYTWRFATKKEHERALDKHLPNRVFRVI